jgi:single-strand DNA-binding protein
MSTLRNRVTLIGRLGKDPEVKELTNNRKMAKFSLATTDVYKNGNGEKKEDTQWHNIVAWGNLAEIASKYLKKGEEVAVEGRVSYRDYEDKNGTKKYITEITLNEILMLGKKSN